LIERFFAWIQWQRRILVRWEYYPQNFLGFVQLAYLVILFRRF
jgi:transposase